MEENPVTSRTTPKEAMAAILERTGLADERSVRRMFAKRRKAYPDRSETGDAGEKGET